MIKPQIHETTLQLKNVSLCKETNVFNNTAVDNMTDKLRCQDQ